MNRTTEMALIIALLLAICFYILIYAGLEIRSLNALNTQYHDYLCGTEFLLSMSESTDPIVVSLQRIASDGQMCKEYKP